MEEEKPRQISEEESAFISSQIDGGFIYITALLQLMRNNNLTLKEAYKLAVEESNQEEHIPSYNRARDFLTQHAERLGIDTAA